jgi:hypothetical protein
MQNYTEHPATKAIEQWINENNITICSINELWQKALNRTSDVIKEENRATLLELHKCCKAAGLIKKIVRLDGINYRVLVTKDYNKSDL